MTPAPRVTAEQIADGRERLLDYLDAIHVSSRCAPEELNRRRDRLHTWLVVHARILLDTAEREATQAAEIESLHGQFKTEMALVLKENTEQAAEIARLTVEIEALRKERDFANTRAEVHHQQRDHFATQAIEQAEQLHTLQAAHAALGKAVVKFRDVKNRAEWMAASIELFALVNLEFDPAKSHADPTRRRARDDKE